MILKTNKNAKAENFHLLEMKCQAIVQQSKNVEDAMQVICNLLQNEMETYDWVGFYMADHIHKTLHIGPYAGKPTEHKSIPFGKGICGQSALTQKTFLIDDVLKEDNYIACSIDVKSEIVVPLFKDQKMIGQIDIDSSKPAAFSEDDEIFLSKVCQLISEKIK